MQDFNVSVMNGGPLDLGADRPIIAGIKSTVESPGW